MENLHSGSAFIRSSQCGFIIQNESKKAVPIKNK